MSLGLADNLIGDDGAAALAELVRQSDTLESLVLSGNDIGNEGGSIMIAALSQNTSLKSLYMADVSLSRKQTHEVYILGINVDLLAIG